MGSKKREKRKKRKVKKRTVRDPHYLYSASVQSVDADIDFFRRVYKKEHGTRFKRLREDFCGTAVLACDWVRRGRENLAWGIDLHQPTLDWGKEHYGPRLGKARERLQLICGDVMTVRPPQVDVIAALNFSYSVFKTRDQLRRYFSTVRSGLLPGGMVFLDAWGGTEALCEDVEKRKIDAETAFDGTRIPAFTYVWDQKRFNPVDHHILCYIHFKLPDGTKIKRAFTYDWRLWTLPEMQELLLEAGFASTAVYVEGWDDDADDTDGVFRRRSYFENQAGWIAYVVGLT